MPNTIRNEVLIIPQVV